MTTGLHIYRCENPTRTRVMCPHHKHLCYGERQEFYDTMRILLDCGTVVDYGYGYYDPPKQYSYIVIFKDETGYTAWAPYNAWEKLARQVSLDRARTVARQQLRVGGRIVERIN